MLVELGGKHNRDGVTLEQKVSVLVREEKFTLSC